MAGVTVNPHRTDCLFCTMEVERVVMENDLAYAVRDAFPVTPGHCLVIPKRHIPDCFTMTIEELIACDEITRTMREALLRGDPTIAGFNVGTNAGAAAGQTVFHCHFHLIPRREGDVENPRGGVRHTIPGKGNY